MKHWISLVNVPELEQYSAIASFAEEVGFHGITIADHLVMPTVIDSRYPYTPDGKLWWPEDTPWPDPWVALTAMGAATKTLKLASNIYLAGLRDVFTAAKMVASAAAFTAPERIICGVSVGWIREEYELLGIDFHSRGKRLDEMIEVMQALWSGQKIDHSGRFFDFKNAIMHPAPGRLPIWCGGNAPAALHRAAANDGWLGLPLTLEQILQVSAQLMAMRRELGLADRPFDICYSLLSELDEDARQRLTEAGALNHMGVPWLPSPWGAPSWADPEDDPANLDCKKKAMERYARKMIA